MNVFVLQGVNRLACWLLHFGNQAIHAYGNGTKYLIPWHI